MILAIYQTLKSSNPLLWSLNFFAFAFIFLFLFQDETRDFLTRGLDPWIKPTLTANVVDGQVYISYSRIIFFDKPNGFYRAEINRLNGSAFPICHSNEKGRAFLITDPASYAPLKPEIFLANPKCAIAPSAFGSYSLNGSFCDNPECNHPVPHDPVFFEIKPSEAALHP